MLLLLIVGGFYSFIIPALPTLWAIVAGVAYGVLASSTVVAGVAACLKDPIDPNVRRFHEVGCDYLVGFYSVDVSIRKWHSCCSRPPQWTAIMLAFQLGPSVRYYCYPCDEACFGLPSI